MLAQQSFQQYLTELASGSPTPGGGAVAALSASQGAALVSMVCNLTIGKKKYADVEEAMRAVQAKAEIWWQKLLAMADEDAQAFDLVMAAYHLPKGTVEEKNTRTAAIQKALKVAEGTPMRTVEACVEVLSLCLPVAMNGNKNVVSDAVVAAHMSYAGLQSAAVNVRINLNSIKDADFVARETKKLQGLLTEAERKYQEAITEGSKRL